MEKIKFLLNQVRNISNKYKEIAIVKGENFNLFDIMGMRTDEVKTHSAIIAELLNPKGSHDMGTVFLKLFMQKLIPIITQPNEYERHKYLLNSYLLKTQAIVEFNISQIKENLTEGGRIDILLSNDEFEICIENKIYAGDQPFQLRRYHNYLTESNKTNNKKTLLIYLTLDGKSASKESTCISKFINGNWVKDESVLLEENKDYFCISYQTEILKWLEECHSLTIDKPILRESLKQYILLIRSLTNQATNNNMATEIHKAILTDISSAAKINGEFDNAIKYISTKMRDAVTERLKKIYTNASIENEKEGNPFSCIYVWFAEAKHFGIESFNRKSIFDKNRDSDTFLFIGQMDWNGKKNGRTDIVKGVWIDGTQQTIWNRNTLDEQLQKYSQGDERIINELVETIKKYIDDNL